MIISHELSMIQMNAPRSAELASNVEAFLSAGGAIQELASFKYAPPPIRHEPEPSKRVAPRRRAAGPNKFGRMTQRDIEREARAKERADLVERIRGLALTMTQSEVQQLTGINRRKLLTLSQDNGFTYKKPTRSGANDSARLEQVAARDARLAERIRAFLELGITRRQCCGRLAIGNKTFERIINAHGIDYPKAHQGSTSCAA